MKKNPKPNQKSVSAEIIPYWGGGGVRGKKRYYLHHNRQ